MLRSEIIQLLRQCSSGKHCDNCEYDKQPNCKDEFMMNLANDIECGYATLKIIDDAYHKCLEKEYYNVGVYIYDFNNISGISDRIRCTNVNMIKSGEYNNILKYVFNNGSAFSIIRGGFDSARCRRYNTIIIDKRLDSDLITEYILPTARTYYPNYRNPSVYFEPEIIYIDI